MCKPIIIFGVPFQCYKYIVLVLLVRVTVHSSIARWHVEIINFVEEVRTYVRSYNAISVSELQCQDKMICWEVVSWPVLCYHPYPYTVHLVTFLRFVITCLRHFLVPSCCLKSHQTDISFAYSRETTLAGVANTFRESIIDQRFDQIM